MCKLGRRLYACGCFLKYYIAEPCPWCPETDVDCVYRTYLYDRDYPSGFKCGMCAERDRRRRERDEEERRRRRLEEERRRRDEEERKKKRDGEDRKRESDGEERKWKQSARR